MKLGGDSSTRQIHSFNDTYEKKEGIENAVDE